MIRFGADSPRLPPASRSARRPRGHRRCRAGSRLCREAAGRRCNDARAAPLPRVPNRECARGDAFPSGRSGCASCRARSLRSGSSTFTAWKRRVSAGSFSMCFLYSAQVVAPIVRNVPRASAGLSRFAASPVPAGPPAPTSVWTSSMNSTIGLGDDCTSSMIWRRRCSNSPFMLAPAWSRPMSSARSVTPCSGGGTSPLTMRRARPFDDGGFPDARFTGQNRIVLATAHEDVDDLTDLFVASDDGVDLAALACAVRSTVKRARAACCLCADAAPRR